MTNPALREHMRPPTPSHSRQIEPGGSRLSHGFSNTVHGEHVALINQRSHLIDLAVRIKKLHSDDAPNINQASPDPSSKVPIRPIRPTRSTTLGLDLGPQSFLFQWELPVSGDGHRLSQILTAWASSYFLPMLKSDRKRRRGRGHSKRKKDTEEALDSIKRRFFLPSLFQK